MTFMGNLFDNAVQLFQSTGVDELMDSFQGDNLAATIADAGVLPEDLAGLTDSEVFSTLAARGADVSALVEDGLAGEIAAMVRG